MKINHYQDVISIAGCSVIAIAVCRLIDTGSTMQQAADLIGISQVKACSLYQKCAVKIQDAHHQVQPRPNRPYTACDTSHFARARQIFPSLDWTGYCLSRLLNGLKVAPTREYMRKALGISANLTSTKLNELVEIGAVLSCQKLPKPVQSADDLHRHQSYIYQCEIHEFFKSLDNGSIG